MTENFDMKKILITVITVVMLLVTIPQLVNIGDNKYNLYTDNTPNLEPDYIIDYDPNTFVANFIKGDYTYLDNITVEDVDIKIKYATIMNMEIKLFLTKQSDNVKFYYHTDDIDHFIVFINSTSLDETGGVFNVNYESVIIKIWL